MKKKLISSAATNFYKYYFYAALGMFFVISILQVPMQTDTEMIVFLFIFFSISMMVHAHFKYADKVYDCGDSLLIKKGGKEDSIKFSDILNINFFIYGIIPTAELKLNQKSKFGKKIRFCPSTPWKLSWEYNQNDTVDELIAKAYEARKTT